MRNIRRKRVKWEIWPSAFVRRSSSARGPLQLGHTIAKGYWAVSTIEWSDATFLQLEDSYILLLLEYPCHLKKMIISLVMRSWKSDYIGLWPCCLKLVFCLLYHGLNDHPRLIPTLSNANILRCDKRINTIRQYEESIRAKKAATKLAKRATGSESSWG